MPPRIPTSGYLGARPASYASGLPSPCPTKPRGAGPGLLGAPAASGTDLRHRLRSHDRSGSGTPVPGSMAAAGPTAAGPGAAATASEGGGELRGGRRQRWRRRELGEGAIKIAVAPGVRADWPQVLWVARMPGVPPARGWRRWRGRPRRHRSALNTMGALLAGSSICRWDVGFVVVVEFDKKSSNRGALHPGRLVENKMIRPRRNSSETGPSDSAFHSACCRGRTNDVIWAAAGETWLFLLTCCASGNEIVLELRRAR